MAMSYRAAAETLWGEAGTYAHDAYERIRAQHYPDLPRQLPIVIGITAYGSCLGITCTNWAHGPRISIFSSLFRQGRRAVDDVLVHEMLHASLALAGLKFQHNSPPWYEAVRRLSPAVLGHGLEVRCGGDRKSVRIPNAAWEEGNGQPRTLVRKVREECAVPHSAVATWPGAFRPEGYDWGEPIECPSY